MSWQQELVELLPWVKRYKKPRPCDDYRWSHMPLKAVYNPELKERYRCKNTAVWRFTSSKRKTRGYVNFKGRDGVYCWTHLNSQLDAMDELKRANTWRAQHIDQVNEIRVRGGVNPISINTKKEESSGSR